MMHQLAVPRFSPARVYELRKSHGFQCFLRVCRVLGLVEYFESLVPEGVASPMERLKRQGWKRQRASGKKVGPSKPGKWTWGDES